ncbi:hypothetical protein Droror1_Dr00009007 [Drosera rotundifolia]
MAALLKVVSILLTCIIGVIVIAPMMNADFLPFQMREGFRVSCGKYVESGTECALTSTCCSMLKSMAKALPRSPTDEEKAHACLSVKAALYDMDDYSYNNTRDMMLKCKSSLPFAISRGADCYKPKTTQSLSN